MDIRQYMKKEGERPLDSIVTNGGFCGIFRRIACIGDSLSSGEFQSYENEAHGYHDFYEYSWGQYMARDAGCTVYNFSKGGMTAQVARMLDIDRKNIFCIGDNQNDIPMLAQSAIPFAPADCAQEVKDWGARLLCPCEEGAVAQAIGIIEKERERH